MMATKQAKIITKQVSFSVDADTVAFEDGWLRYTANGNRISTPSTQVIKVIIPVTVTA